MIKTIIPKSIGLLSRVPEEDRPKGEEEVRFWQAVAYELSQMIRYASQAENTEIVLNDMRQAGPQYIWEFYVNDLSIPRADEINWHGQNTSQWLYAGGLVVSGGRVSTHH